jgi:predicted RND superfamily exporter protein
MSSLTILMRNKKKYFSNHYLLTLTFKLQRKSSFVNYIFILAERKLKKIENNYILKKYVIGLYVTVNNLNKITNNCDTSSMRDMY